MKTNQSISHPKYRADIDGLRAIAVLSVVAFHAFPNSIKGGFVGVDIFFVISGFLISTIIFENLSNDSFSFADFYARRVKRIFPALVLVLATCLGFGWYILLGDEYKQLGKHVAGGAGFMSNFILWGEAGYFDNSAETKPLLHLWSLGIEEQFYLVWPLLLWGAYKKRFNLLTVTIVVALVSFILNVKGIDRDAVATFYSPQTRFWELLSGGLVAWTMLTRRDRVSSLRAKIDTRLANIVYRDLRGGDGATLNNVLAFLGLFLVLYAVWRLDKSMSFPGKWAAVPVMGAVLLIGAGQHAWVNRTILANRVAVWFGLISFPLYLWHWPLLSFARILTADTLTPAIRNTAVLLSIVLAWLTYRVVERPFRFGAHSTVKVFVLVIVMIGTGSAGYVVFKRDGFALRPVATSNVFIQSGEDGGAGRNMTQCNLGEQIDAAVNCFKDTRQVPKFALIGDSKAGALLSGVMRKSIDEGRWMFFGIKVDNHGPLPVISDDPIYKNYQLAAHLALDSLAKNPDIKVVAFAAATRLLFALDSKIGADRDISGLPDSPNFDVAKQGLLNAIRVLRSSGKKVVLVVDNPTLPYPQDCFNRQSDIALINKYMTRENMQCVLPLEKHLALTARYRKLLEEVRATYPDDVFVFDTTPILCDEVEHVCKAKQNGRAMYWISDHISDYASGLVGAQLNPFVVNLINR